MSDTSTIASDQRTRRLLTVQEVAEWLGLSPGTLRYWRHVHRGPRSLSVGGAVRYRVHDVEAWLDAPANEKRPADEPGASTTSAGGGGGDGSG